MVGEPARIRGHDGVADRLLRTTEEGMDKYQGLEIKIVPAGTKIELLGQELEVTDTTAVRKGGTFYVTEAVLEMIKRRAAGPTELAA
jgi:hypothetical protein